MRELLGLMPNMVFGRNSPVMIITAVDISVWLMSMKNSFGDIWARSGSSRAAAPMPYTTSIMLLPTSMVDINSSELE